MQNKQYLKAKSFDLLEVKKRVLSSGAVIALVIICSPLLFYAYQGFPDEQSWESFFGIYDSVHYGSVQTLAWVLFGKLVPIILLLLWFFTCKHWWYHAILIPIVMYMLQIYNTLDDDLNFTDSNEFYIILPMIAIIAAISYTIRTKIFDRLYGVDLDQEFKRVRWNGKIVKIPADSPLDIPEVGDDEIDD